jgi:hypothetical protein
MLKVNSQECDLAFKEDLEPFKMIEFIESMTNP